MFFDLGPIKRGCSDYIGEKGHGTKVFFNCHSIRVETVRDGARLIAIMDAPFERLNAGEMPRATVVEEDAAGTPPGTTIVIKGFNGNDGAPFTHDNLRDYALWFTKFGSWERQIGIDGNKDKIFILKGLDREAPEALTFGHVFPAESSGRQGSFSHSISPAHRTTIANVS